MTSQCKIDLTFEVGECLRWNPNRQILSWVDIPFGAYFEGSLQPDLKIERQFKVQGELGSAVHIGDDVYLLYENHIDILRLDGTTQTLFVDEEMDRNKRYNDANVDSQGRIVAGIMDKDAAEGRGSLVRFDPKTSAYETIWDGLTIPNGIAWSTDYSQMYFAESMHGLIYSATYLEPRLDFNPLISIDRIDGYPDGLEVDAEGNILVAIWAGSEIWKFSSAGRVLEKFTLPAKNPTSVCIVGDQNRIFAISGRQHIAEPGIDDGRLYEVLSL